MKTLLLSLVVVAFVYLDSGHTYECHSCEGSLCYNPQNCLDAMGCYKKTYDLFGLKVVKGCATNCTFLEGDEKILLCGKDRCNI
nr:three-finger toxin [Heterodon nasicus]